MGHSTALAGIRVLDFGRMAAAPYAGMLLADLGADVVKVEPLEGDECRKLGPPFIGEDGAQFLALNRGKRSLAIDMRSAEARPILETLVKGCDITIHNFRASTADAMGLGYDGLRALRPDLIYCAISGFGTDGPWAGRPGVDLVFQGFSGMMSVTGRPDDGPLRPGVPIADLSTALSAFGGILGALVHRLRTGMGQRVDVAAIDALMAMQSTVFAYTFATGENPPRMGNGSPYAISNAFATADGHITLSITSNKFWRRLVAALDLEGQLLRPEFESNAGRLAGMSEIYSVLGARFRTASTAHWLSLLAEAEVPCGPVLTFQEVLQQEQVAVNGTVVKLAHGAAGGVAGISAPMKLSGCPARYTAAAPLRGEQSRSVLRDIGLAADAIEDLITRGIVFAGERRHEQ